MISINSNRIKGVKFLGLLVLLGGMVGCSNKNSANEQGVQAPAAIPAKPAPEHEEEAPTIATMNEEQISTIGIEYGDIEQKQLTATIKANGNLNVPNNNKASVGSLYGGTIKTLNVQIGSHVRPGQVIATIANPQFIQLQEEYLSLGSKITFSEQEAQRQKELNEGSAGALKNLQSATAELSALRTRRASLQQQLQMMGINPSGLNNTNMRSVLAITTPIGGAVSNVFAKIGSFVDPSSPVAEVVDNGQLHLDLNIFEKDLQLLKVGQTIHFTLTNNPKVEYDAEVFSIGSAFENQSKTIPVHCTVKGNKEGLIDGMNVTGFVSVNDVTSPAIPNDAIVEADGKNYIFIVTDKSPEEHHEEGEEGHEEEPVAKGSINFEKIEVVKGVSNLGYTAITFIRDIPQPSKVVVKGAFFINAKLTNTEGHSH